MKRQIVGLLAFSLFILNRSVVFSQTIQLKTETEEEPKVGIRISQAKFDSLVAKFNHLMQKKDSITAIDDNITLARLFNTIYYSGLLDIDQYKELVYLYVQFNYSMAVIKKLDMVGQKGLWYRSAKYDINLGGPPDAKSQFLIIPN